MTEVRVLVVDDEEGIRHVLHRLLRRIPHERVSVESAGNVDEAIHLLESRSFDLLLTDFNMPGRNGSALLEVARARWPNTVRVMMTGYTDDEVSTEAHERGEVAAFIRKPWNNEELLSTLGRLLAAHRSAAAA